MGGSNTIALVASSVRKMGGTSCIKPDNYTEGWIPNWHCLGVVTERCKGQDGKTVDYADAVFQYPDEQDSPGIDVTFSIHIFFGFLWVLIAFLQMVPIRTFNLKMHRYFGYFAAATLFTFMMTTFQILFFDVVKNPLSFRIATGSVTIMCIVYMVMGIMAARRHNLQDHTDFTMRAFVYSLEGAGTIRMVRKGFNSLGHPKQCPTFCPMKFLN